MAIWDIFRRQRAPETKQSAIAATLVVAGGQAVWSARDYAAFAQEAYQKNVVAYQAINRVGEAAASVRWTAWKGETEIIQHPLLDLLKRPNIGQSGAQWVQEAIAYLLLSGNLYQERVDLGGGPRELYNHRPDRMKVVPALGGGVARYEYSVSGRKVTWDNDPVSGAGPIRHIKLFNPLSDWYGMSPAEAAAYAIDQHNAAMAWMQALLQNSARPSGALKSADQLTDEQFIRLKATIEEQYAGAVNAGRPMLLEGGLDWVTMAHTPSELGIEAVKNSAARDIALAYGVPPQLLGIPGDNTYSNYQEARLAFWEDTVIPLVDTLAQEWTAWLGEEAGVEIRADYDHIPAIVDKRATLWEMAEASTDLTVNETRILKGFEELPDERGDKLKSEIRSAAAPQPDPQAQQDHQAQQDQPQDMPAAKALQVLEAMAYGSGREAP